MESILVTTTSTEGLKPLGTAPQRSFELIVSSLEGRAATQLFAEPVSSNFGDTVDWYTALSGRPRPMAELDEAEKETLKARLEERVAEVRDAAERVLAENPENSDNQRLAEALTNALEIPSEESIFGIVGPDGTVEPVLVNWAWVADQQKVVRGVLSATDTRHAASASAAAAAAAARSTEGDAGAVEAGQAKAARVATPVNPLLWWWLYWFGWLILALLLAAILILLIAPCSLRLPGLPSYCIVGEAEASEEERLAAALRDEVGILERQIAIADRACQPPIERPAFLPPRIAVPEPPVRAVPPETDTTQIDDRLDRVGAEVGDLTFSLIWNGPDDLDLEVTCPTGDRLFWGTRNACNGSKDIDTGVGAPAPEPVENIFFNTPVPGAYDLRVTMPTSRSNGAAQPFQLQIRDGADVQILEGVVSGREREWTSIYEFGGR